MPDEKPEDAGFKVVDRRSFTEDGSPRSSQAGSPEPKTPPAEQPAARLTGTTPAPRPAPERPVSRRVEPADLLGDEEELDEDQPAGFDTLVYYLATTAMFQLGQAAGPSGERIPPDLPNARRTVDLLEVLEEKTRGNLTAEEAKLLEEILYELRMAYLEMEKREKRK